MKILQKTMDFWTAYQASKNGKWMTRDNRGIDYKIDANTIHMRNKESGGYGSMPNAFTAADINATNWVIIDD